MSNEVMTSGLIDQQEVQAVTVSKLSQISPGVAVRLVRRSDQCWRQEQVGEG